MSFEFFKLKYCIKYTTFKKITPVPILWNKNEQKFEEKNKEIRKELGRRVRHQLRSIPELKFFIDDTLDYVFKMEELFNKIKKEDEGKQP